MFEDYVLELSSAKYNNKILLIDDEKIDETIHYSVGFQKQGFEIVRYKEDLLFRIEHGDEFGNPDKKLLVITESNRFIPYDIYRKLRVYSLSMDRLFPKLNEYELKKQHSLDLDLLWLAYNKNFEDFQQRKQTEEFIQNQVYGTKNISLYLEKQYEKIMRRVRDAKKHQDWLGIAELKADIDVLNTKYSLDFDTSEINRVFRDYVLLEFGKLSSEMNRETPVLVSKAMEYMHDHSEKFVVIVMDGMSEFDWKIISKSFYDIPYEQTATFAMIPTTTSISRQCLLSNKYPSQLIEPWKQSKEKKEFVACAKKLGFAESQIGYGRGYDAQFGSFVRCGTVIINDVDNMVHDQHQGRLGMLNDISVLADQHKLADMVKRFRLEGFDIYITADHGNTPCTGIGKLMGTGLETETKSRRMVVLQSFADKNFLQQKHGLIEYPKYYLNKEFDYLICEVGDSFDAKGEYVMTHGGISIDEVIVPFIKIKAVQENG